jgi:hypothetical protein
MAAILMRRAAAIRVRAMRLKYLDAESCLQCYAERSQSIEEPGSGSQTCWYFHASMLVWLAKAAYAVERPLMECRAWLRQATAAYRELFRLRGTTFSDRVLYQNGKPLPEERVPDDGYTSVESFNAVLVALALRDIQCAQELVALAGHSPNAELVSPRSEVCTTNQQTLSHALNALVGSEMDLAKAEASKFTVRSATRIEKQIALTISAIANDGDVLTERDSLLFYHEQMALRRDNQGAAEYWLCLPALGLSFLAMHFRGYEPDSLRTDSVYCPIELLSD